MRNKLTLIINLLCILLLANSAKGQLIDNNLNVSLSYNIGVFHGNENVIKGNFRYPSLFSNMNHLSGFSVAAVKKIRPNVSYGLCYTKSNAYNWEMGDNSLYLKSELYFSELATIFRYHNKFANTKIFNRLNLFAELSPVIGISNFKSETPLFEIQPMSYEPIAPTKGYDIFVGIKSGIGAGLSLSRSIGVIASYTFNSNIIKSKFYSDNHYLASQVNVGLFIKLMNDKRFLYKH